MRAKIQKSKSGLSLPSSQISFTLLFLPS